VRIFRRMASSAAATAAPNGGLPGGARSVRYVGEVRLLSVNDIYSPRAVDGLGGWPLLSSLLKRYRTPNSLTLVCGDFLGGSALAEHYKGQNVTKLMDHLRTDIVGIGNHEFDFGSEGMKQRMGEIRHCHWLGSNILEKEREEQDATQETLPLLKGVTDLLQVRVKLQREKADGEATTNHDSSSAASDAVFPETTDASIGLFGVCTAHTPQLSWPGPLVSFAPVMPVAERCANQLTGAAPVNGPVPVIQLPRHSHPSDDASAASSPSPVSAAAASAASPTANGIAAAPLFTPSDVLVAVTHLSLGEDRRLARALPSLTAILGGHDHDATALMEGNTLVFKCGQNAIWLGIVDLRVEVELTTRGGSGPDASTVERKVSCFPSWRMVSSREVLPDPEVERMVEQSIADMEAAQAAASGDDLDEIVATVGEPSALPEGQDTLTHEQAAQVLLTRTAATRAGPSSFADLIADAMAAHYNSVRGEGADGRPLSGCDGAFINGGFIRGDKFYPLGAQLSVRDIRYELPFPKVCVLLRIRGEHIVSALNGMLTPHPAPAGCYPHVSAEWRVEYDASLPGGSAGKVKGVWHRGEPLDPAREYILAVTTFMHGGGDGIAGFTQGRKISTSSNEQRVSDLVLKHVRNIKTIHPNLRPRVRAV